MTTLNLNIFIFIVTVIVFGLYAVPAARRITSPKTFFHRQELPANIISLTAANVTLGTGLAYLLLGGQQNGILMLFIPVMVWLGYYLLAHFTSRYVASDVLTGTNFLTGINERIAARTGTPSPFGLVVTVSLIVVYTLILPYEIFASSKIIAPLLFTQGGNTPAIVLSIIIFFAALLYVIFGGIAAVFATDKLQLGAILLFIPILAFIVFAYPSQDREPLLTLGFVLKLDTTVIFNVIAASVAALSTQFYSLLNWGYISHMEAAHREQLLKWVGGLAALILTVIVAVGVFYPVKEGGDVVTDLMALYARIGSQSGILIWVLSGISVLGMTSIVFSTVDSLIIKIIMFYYDNVAKRRSMSEEANPKELKSIRGMVFISFLLIFLILGYFNFIQPNLFYLLLAIAGGVTVFGPMLATVGYLSSKGDALKIFSRGVVWSYFGLFLLAGVVSVSALLLKPAMLGWIGTLTFIISGLYSVFLIIRSRQI